MSTIRFAGMPDIVVWSESRPTLDIAKTQDGRHFSNINCYHFRQNISRFGVYHSVFGHARHCGAIRK